MRLTLYASLCFGVTAFVNVPSVDRKFSHSLLSMMDIPSDVSINSESAMNSISYNLQPSTFQTPGFHLAKGVRDFLVPPANAAEASFKPPTNDEIKLLRTAFEALYGERNPVKGEELITKAISAWERQAPDERAALYRVRGDCYMVRKKFNHFDEVP